MGADNGFGTGQEPSVTKDHEEWFDDSMDAVSSVLPNWVPGYRSVKMTDVNENGLSSI
jgi:hypothetical protein